MNKHTYIYIGVGILILLLIHSCKSAKLSDAVERHERGEYYEAAQIYRRVYQKTSSQKTHLRGSIAFHMAECYREINNPNKALSGYTNAIRYDYTDSTMYLHQAQMNHKLSKYGDAIKQYDKFLTIDSLSLLAKYGIEGCLLSPDWKKNPTRYVVKKMDKWNSRNGEFSPMLYGEEFDQLYFTSSRKDATGDENSLITGVKNNDFFVIKQDEKKQWIKPEKIESGVNTENDEGTASFTADGSQMYYTYCHSAVDADYTAEVRVSSRSGAQWSAGTRVEIFKDTTFMAAHPAVGADGYLYFVSDIIGGYGGKDIYRVPIDGIGVLFPENLGPEINTSGDEMFPYMRADSVLFFSSDGHPGMGGLDIFRATEYKGKWRVENMKAPINSSGDDFGITFRGVEESGYFSSNRNDGRGSDHIYSFELPGIYRYVEGWVLDKDENEITGAAVRIVGKDGTNERIFTRGDGTYFMEVKPGVEYVMMGSAPGYLNQKQTLTVPDEEKSANYYVDFYLSSISKPVLIENIFYDFDKATLRSESKEALDELIAMLEDNPNVTIELMAHTDRKGKDEYNDNLSQRRAQSVVDYLIRSGVEADRLTAKGYGESTPATVSKKIAEQYDFLPEGQLLDEAFIETLDPVQQARADQINRRTEFRVLSTNYKLM
ncbi:peptidoglycan-associated lipoprotein [Dysgonomonadaceae bacterium PH5-43]|nr:peptidoglycan-associated lipoprotein [Dysgonomonadaceae bacterium PH5-43]